MSLAEWVIIFSISLTSHLLSLTTKNKVFNDIDAVGRENRLWVELYAMDIVRTMSQCHDLSLITHGCDF